MSAEKNMNRHRRNLENQGLPPVRLTPFTRLARFLKYKVNTDGDEDLLEPLLPVADSETYQRYSDAFDTIIKSDVTCVAVTGPYGAGKTSLINAFNENHRELKFIRISLATFEGDDEKVVSSDLIEKSILQQLIYSAGRKELEYSRFKKIRKPRWLHAKAFLLSVFAVCTGAAFIYWQEVEEFVAKANRWQDFTIIGATCAFWFLLFFLIIYGILKASAGLSIKKFSLKNAEIETESRSNESVFNKHLDEIIYFFQETPCDIVIIEDLDRFGKTEIFTKIREINQLVNANPDVRPRNKKQIVFLFAIRDDLFQGRDRTKFFDLIIPVIPFVSAGNAYSVLHNKLKKAGLRDSLQDKFLRQVTVYVTDNRHLVNLVNEYSLYRKNLFDLHLDPNKLFAVILYKVFFPNDFGKLHMNEGVLASLVGELQERRKKRRKDLKQELEKISEAEKQVQEGVISSRETLVSAYVGFIQRHYREPIRSFGAVNSGRHVTPHDSVDSILSTLTSSKDIQVTSIRGHTLGSLNVAEMERSIHPGLSLKEKQSAIERHAQLEEDGISQIRSALERKLRDVRYLPINRVFSTDEIKEKVSTFDHGDLFVYLVAEGRIGEDYDDYTSYFHKGATTRADREYVQRFNKGDEIDFDEKVDTSSEILLILGDGLFGKPQGFNITLVDHVLREERHFDYDLVGGLRAFPEQAFRFLEAYYSDGENVRKLLQLLVKVWDGFLDAVATCEDPLPHVKEIIEKTEDGTILAIRKPSKFIDFIEQFSPKVFDSDKLASRLPLLAKSGVLIEDISFPVLSDSARHGAINAVCDYALWQITPNNVATILAAQGVEAQLAESEMFLRLENSPESVFNRIKENINSFVEFCFLAVDSTVAESQEGVEKMLSIPGLKRKIFSPLDR
ncbi:MAG: ATP-binding protein [Akkermansiaceae bacterium]|nr:ATP-binding protein [Akkermansiaceae bacterium]